MKIAAFNVKRLGLKKMNNERVRNNLIKIVSRYSVVVFLEVLDRCGEAMKRFLQELNNYRENRRSPYAMKSSAFLGRSSYREKFVYFYRKNEVAVTDSFQYEEEDEDVLAREPFILRLHCPYAAVQDLVLIPVHTKPEDAEIELDALHDVVQAVRGRWRTNNIMILGDLNADGPYLSRRGRESLQISYPPYYWLIDDDVDTTTSDSTDHTYDRIVVYGKRMLNAVVSGSAKAFNFQRAYRLTHAVTQAISDHYPVEVELQEVTDSD